MQRWWGYERSEWLVCEIDLRVGGPWRFVIRDEGMEVGFHGEYREIAAPNRIVQTEVYEGASDPYPNDAALNTLTVNEVDGVTTVTTLVSVANQEIRDGILASGMEEGLQVSQPPGGLRRGGRLSDAPCERTTKSPR